jgi:hypothetical protein
MFLKLVPLLSWQFAEHIALGNLRRYRVFVIHALPPLCNVNW